MTFNFKAFAKGRLALSLFILAALCTAKTTALPGISYYLPDTSGEYIYYTDNTFFSKSIVGFLYYDDTNYAVRYYSPADEKAKTLEKDITCYITIDPDDPKINITGEKITGQSEESDMDIINYLHDLIYDFTKYRRETLLDNMEDKSVKASLDYFGGDVNLTFNSVYPVFNLSKVTKADGKVLLEVQTAGLLSSSTDTSFTDFKGIEGLPKDKARPFKMNRKAQKITGEYLGQSLALDSQWEQNFAENVWMLGDYAVITMNEITVPQTYSEYEGFYMDMNLRKLSLGNEKNYSVWSHRSVSSKGKATSLSSIFYQTEEGSVQRDFKIITKMDDGIYDYISLTVFDSVYQANKKYFDNILKSYKID